MENHPIPQDVTGFQFKLIGNMTIKQFAFLAAGAVLAWITYALPMHIIIKIPFMALFGGVGTALAFFPIEGRPMDVMISNFAKAVFNPTQYIFHQQGGSLYVEPVKIVSNLAVSSQNQPMEKTKLETFLGNLPEKPKNKLDEKEMVFLKSLASYSGPQLQSQPFAQPGYVTPHAFAGQTSQQEGQEDDVQPEQQKTEQEASDQKKPEEVKEEPQEENTNFNIKAEELEKQLQQAKAAEEAAAIGTQAYEAAHHKVEGLEQALRDTVSQKEALEKELIELRKQLEQNKQVFKPTAIPEQQVQTETKNVRSVPKGMEQKVGIPFAPDFPNVIAGIVKDPRNNPLPNMLVEVKDKEGNPIRAFKTNRLGQFASATPLSDGEYTIEFEDPNGKNKFDTIGFSASGSLIQPIEVISLDEREELRKSLFN